MGEAEPDYPLKKKKFKKVKKGKKVKSSRKKKNIVLDPQTFTDDLKIEGESGGNERFRDGQDDT
jgi:hypothetical protein